MGVLCGWNKISRVRVDVDKDWKGKGISNIKEIAEAMNTGHIAQFDGIRLLKLPPSLENYVLTSQGPGHLVVWASPGSYFHRYFPVTMDINHNAELFTPNYEKLLTAPMTSPHTQTTTPTKAPELALEALAALFTPDHTAGETLPATTGYQAEAHVADAFGHFSIGANNISIVNMIRGSKFMLCEDGTAQSISAYIEVTGTGTVHVKAGIYDTDKNLVAEADQIALAAPVAPAWQTFPFGTPPSLTGGEEYWPIVWAEEVAGSGCIAFYDDADSIGIKQGIYLSDTYNTLPASIAGGTEEKTKFSIYCNYT